MGLVTGVFLLYTVNHDFSVGRWLLENFTLPKCHKCANGDLVPLSDFGSQGAPIHYKAWVCTNPNCGFNIKIRNGDVYLNEPVVSGESHTPRLRN